jgi:hypothetical protein
MIVTRVSPTFVLPTGASTHALDVSRLLRLSKFERRFLAKPISGFRHELRQSKAQEVAARAIINFGANRLLLSYAEMAFSFVQLVE